MNYIFTIELAQAANYALDNHQSLFLSEFLALFCQIIQASSFAVVSYYDVLILVFLMFSQF